MSAATPTTPLSLAPHVRARSFEGQVILLDLRTSRYIGVGKTASSALSQRIKGWPPALAATSVAPSTKQIDINALTDRFIAQGWLGRMEMQNPREDSIPMADASLDFEDLSMQIEIGAWGVMRLLHGAALSAFRLRFQSLDAIARTVSARRSNQHCGQVAPPVVQLASMRTSAIAYERLRPFLFTSHRKCLFDSLTLLEFLSGEGLFPYWVIGVKTKPFGAHSWVQYGSTVLNDQHARVRQFQPILIA